MNISGINSKTSNYNTGFTLLEILVVMVLIAIIATFIGVSLTKSISSAEIRMAGRELLAAMRYARVQAIVHREEQRLIINTEEKTYEVPSKKNKGKFPEQINVTLLTAKQEIDEEHIGAIRFFPDGSSTGGKITLSAKNKGWVVNVAWLTGEVTLSEERYN